MWGAIPARAIGACRIKTEVPLASFPLAAQKYRTGKEAPSHLARMERTSEHHSRLEDTAVPLALEEDSSPVHSPAVKVLFVVKLTGQQNNLTAVL